MKLSWLALGLVSAGGVASAGGLLLPGAGAVSTSRAGASTVAADDGEAISLNPAGIAKAKGTTITFGIAAIDYYLAFTRAGNYPNITEESTTYAGTPYPTMTNNAKPPLGFGSFQPVPLIAIVSDLGGLVPNLHVGFGLYAPNAYPFRDFQTVNGKPWVFNSNIEDPPPPTRYDMIHEEAALILPSLAASYRITPDLDVGVRFSAGVATVKSTAQVWGLANQEEWQQLDGQFSIDASGFVHTEAIGVNYRVTPEIEVGGRYTTPIYVHAVGTAESANGPAVTLSGSPVVVSPVADADARCAKGGTMAKLKGCVDFELPMTATVGGRYKFLDEQGQEKGDVELDVGWENWGAKCDYNKDPKCLDPSDFRVVVDAIVGTQMDPNALSLKDNHISHGLQDVWNVRLGGSWKFLMSNNDAIVARGGVSYDTAAAQPGWERIDLDGAARTMISAGASYKMRRLSIDAGFGFIAEGTRDQNRNCIPPNTLSGCGPSGSIQPVEGYTPTGPFRQGPDPINPILNPDVQIEHPVNQGKFDSHYYLLMLGMSTWF
jgi:long-subunit fatty acid transport protein